MSDFLAECHFSRFSSDKFLNYTSNPQIVNRTADSRLDPTSFISTRAGSCRFKWFSTSHYSTAYSDAISIFGKQ